MKFFSKELAGIIGGLFVTLYSGITVWGNAGDLDTTFLPDTYSSDVFYSMAIQSDGKIVVAGRRNTLAPIYGVIYRLNKNGTSDRDFSSGPYATGVTSLNPKIDSVTLFQSDAKILVCGGFDYYYNSAMGYDVTSPRLLSLDQNGNINANFSSSANGEVFVSVVQDNQHILIGGSFTNFMGTGQNYIARIFNNGTPDISFNTGTGPGDTVRAIALEANGNILIGGDFTNVDGLSLPYLARLSPDGTLDNSYCPSPDEPVYTIVIQPSDQKAVIGGYFLNVAGTSHNRIARINQDGTLDTNFNADCGFVNSMVWALALQQNGKIVAGGRFNDVNGCKKVARFMPSDGSVDSTFTSSTGVAIGYGTSNSDEVRSICIQDDGNILIAGKFTTFSGESRYGIARLVGDPYEPPTIQKPYNTVIQTNITFINQGDPLTLTATTDGDLPMTCTWSFNENTLNTSILTQRKSTLTVPNIQMQNYGKYKVVMQNAAGSCEYAITLQPVLKIRPDKTVEINCPVNYVLKASTNLSDWIPVSTNQTFYSNHVYYEKRFFRIELK